MIFQIYLDPTVRSVMNRYGVAIGQQSDQRANEILELYRLDSMMHVARLTLLSMRVHVKNISIFRSSFH